jgi:hypothetical protein
MQERLAALGRPGQTLNLFAAMKISGIADPEVIYRAMDSREFEFNEKLLTNDNPRNDRSWIQIDGASFLRWVERRNHLPIDRVEFYQSEIYIKIGVLQEELYRQGQIISGLYKLLIEKQKNRPVGLRHIKRRKKI